jgi:hypothetical protein
MATNNGKSIFDLTPEEREAGLKVGTAAAVAAAFEKGLPVAYRDERCPSVNHFVHEYADGRQFLVLLDVDTGKEEVIKELTNA